jgi:hypothetical protein
MPTVADRADPIASLLDLVGRFLDRQGQPFEILDIVDAVVARHNQPQGAPTAAAAIVPADPIKKCRRLTFSMTFMSSSRGSGPLLCIVGKGSMTK